VASGLGNHQNGCVRYELHARPSERSSESRSLLRKLVPRLKARADELGHIQQEGSGPGFKIYAVGNASAKEDRLGPHAFFVACWALYDDDGTYQEPPHRPYRVTWTNGRGVPVREEIEARDQTRVLSLFDDFLDTLLPSSDEEALLLEIGRDPSKPLALRRRALGRVEQTEVDPWPAGLDDAYASILEDGTLSLIERIAVAYDCSAYGDPLQAERRRLLVEADGLDDLPSSIELRLASEIGSASGLGRLLRLAKSDDKKIAKDARDRLGWMSHNQQESPSIRQAAFSASMGRVVSVGHVFVSYVREDSFEVEKLTIALRELGVSIWRDRDRLRPGERWRFKISEAIKEGNAFLAIFSSQSENRERSYMRQELIEAVEELRLRPMSRAWFFPVLLSPCAIPEVRIGPGETLRDLHYAALYDSWEVGIQQLAAALNEAVL